jgi:hypothetical protein
MDMQKKAKHSKITSFFMKSSGSPSAMRPISLDACDNLFARLHGVILQKAAIVTFTATRNSNLTLRLQSETYLVVMSVLCDCVLIYRCHKNFQ